MIDVKKLIIGFLILAGAAVCSGIILWFANFSSAPPTTALGPTITPATSSFTGNSFLPEEDAPVFSDASDTAGDSGATSSLITASDTNNLTDIVADSFVGQAIDANPGGVTMDNNGDPILTNSVDPTSVASDVLSVTSSTVQGLSVPDWNVEAGSQPIDVVSSSPENVTSYATALNGIFNQYFISTQLESELASANGDSSELSYVLSQVKSALSDTIALKVPSNLVGFQKSLVQSMVYEKNEAELVQNAGADPMKTAIILEDEQDQYLATMTDLQQQMQAAQSLGLLFGTSTLQDNSVPFIAEIFGVQPAHAIFGIGDITFDPSVFMQMIKQYLNDIALQILKNTLIALIQNKVLGWVQGSGAPRFVQNWMDTAINAWQQSAIGFINSKMQCGVYAPFLPQMQLTLRTFYMPQSTTQCANQFAAALGSYSFQQFYNNFQNGGFLAINTMMLPTGNPWTAAFFNAQTIGNVANTAQNTNQNQNIASFGFTSGNGASTCKDGSNPGGSTTYCADANGVYDTNTQFNAKSCPSGDHLIAVPNNGMCSDGSAPSVATPASALGFGVSSALDSSPKLVTAANDIVGLIGAVTASLLNSLANMAITAANNAVNSGLSGGDAGLQGAPPVNPPATTPPPALPLACNPTSQITSSTYGVVFAASGGKTNTDGTDPTYTWTSSDGQTGSGYTFSPTYNASGTYTVTLSDSTGDAAQTCSVTVQ